MFLFLNRAQSICPRCTAACRLIVQPWTPPPRFRYSFFGSQVPPRPYDVRDPSRERWKYGQECWPIICLNVDFQLEIFYMPQVCNMGPTAVLPFQRKARWGFFRPEKSWRLRPGLNPWTWVLNL
jgi:hypothetical protein